MNIARPVSSEITRIEFSFLSTQEVEQLSVKQITNPVLLDNLGHPTRGGLYDLALGPFLRGTVCATCSLDERYCPGHFGHISLPVPVYHPLYFTQMYNLLRSICLYCHHFRLAKTEVHRYACKLRLIDAGLLIEAEDLDLLQAKVKKGRKKAETKDEEDDEETDDDDADSFMERRDKYVRDCLRRAGPYKTKKTTMLGEARRRLILDFLKKLGSRKKCDNCQAISPSYRKDGYAKIFEMPLNKKAALYMQQAGIRRVNVLNSSKAKGATRDADAMDVDEDEEEEENGISTMSDDEIEVNIEESDSKASGASGKYVPCAEIRNHLRLLFINERQMCSLLYRARGKDGSGADQFFMHVLAVPPTKFRPPSKMGDAVHENIQNELLTKVLQSCQMIRDLNDQIQKSQDPEADEDAKSLGKVSFERLINAFVQVQHDVNSFIDSTRNPTTLPQGKLPPPGIKQVLEKKEGLFRKHMMGKRVNYAARSVISPDPNIETSEIGVPPVFATKLTYPEPVTPFNVQELRRAVINGPSVWPGATHIQNEDGRLVSLATMSVEQRTALANQLLTPQDSRVSGFANSRVMSTNKKVYRHLKDQDVLLLNRQPTLHKPSIMAHRARVLPGEKTIRMHYANCNTYNADFDGDEMNMHLPQNEIARAEAMMIANTDSQYLVPTSGDPLRGLIQDHVVMGVWMCNKDTWYTREEYQQLLYGSLKPEDSTANEGRILTLPPAIMKPKPMWSGKQILSTVLLNLKPSDRPGLNLRAKAKVAGKFWSPKSEEGVVIFHDGYLCQGVLDKAAFGASAYGLVHSVYEIYGATIAGKLLSVLGRLFTKYTQSRGFTCRMDDLRLNPEGDRWRNDLKKAGANFGTDAAREYVGLPKEADGSKRDAAELKKRMEEVLRDDEKLAGLDSAMKGKMNGLTSSIINKCIPDGLLKKFPHNHMQTMTVSGAKGSNVNVSQISCLLGQQELEGRRVPIMVSGKSLPSFKAFDTNARAGGFIAQRFLTGIRPQEYYFHCMAGREGLIDTAVKTSRSGYLQRCLIKHLEGIRVHYDHTVRDSDGSLIQFHYGEDSLDVTKSKHLMEFEFSARNYKSLIQKYNVASSLSALDSQTAIDYAKKAIKKPAKYDPVLSKYDPSRYLGAMSEAFQTASEEYVEKNPHALIQAKGKESKLATAAAVLDKKKFRALMQLKYINSLVHPGEAVGILASQSVGEPSTQMTLNTFHFAGFGAKNVTLGIPRLREIVMTASAEIKTPTMTLAIKDEVTDEHAEKFAKSISKLILSQVVDKVSVTERITGQKGNESRQKIYSIRLQFYSKSQYQEEYNITQEDLERCMTSAFIRKLDIAIRKETKKGSRKSKDIGADDALPEIGKASRAAAATAEVDETANVNDDAESDNGDGDATNAKYASREKDQASYEAPDDDDKEIIRKQGRADEDDDDEEDVGRTEPADDDDEMLSDEDEEEYEKRQLAKKQASKSSATRIAERREKVKDLFQNVSDFSFDDVNGEWCEVELTYPSDSRKLLMVNIVEQVCTQTIMHELKGIDRCFRLPNESEMDTSRNLATEGINFKGMWEYQDIIDKDTMYSNDIAAILRTYGVEAARSAIVREVSGVFGVYGIGVDTRHLSLIADYMTFEGGYRAFNRMGIESSSSPFLKMSYETTCHFLTQASLYKDYETLESPSASVVLGKIAGVGTGAFDVRVAL
ncbi:hypothetical protein YB2330_004359 [Saitoella coloradoensis]